MNAVDERSSSPVTTQVRIVGRSSSHFTRVVRMVAAEVGVAYAFDAVPSLLSEDVATYGGNPGLRVPSVVTSDGPVFGALGSARQVAALAPGPQRIVWPEAMTARSAANVLEITLQAMSSEVTLIMVSTTQSGTSAYADKLRYALRNMLTWLDANVDEAIATLPERRTSYLELTLFCLLEHLEFREIMSLEGHDKLQRFRTHFGERPSAKATAYRFDR